MSNAANSNSMSLADWLQLLLLGCVWGATFFFARIAVVEMNPLVLVLFRVSIAAATLHLYLLARGVSFTVALPYAIPLFLLAILNNVIPFSLIFAGQAHLGAGVAAVLNATTPFWTIVLASLLTADERISMNKLAGIGIGIAGTAVMIGPDTLSALDGPVWPKFALVAASLSYAFALMVARRLSRIPPAVVATAQLTCSAIVMAPIVLLTQDASGLFDATPPVWAAVFAMSLMSTAFAYILYFRLIASAGATNASLVTLIVPASAILLGTIFLGERLDTVEIAGISLIGLGLLVIDGRIFRRRLTV